MRSLTSSKSELPERGISEALRKEGISFERDVDLNGLNFDFAMKAPEGRIIVAEAKTWKPTRSNRLRAIEQAILYQKASGADKVFIVLTNLKKGQPSRGLVGLDDLVHALSSELASTGRKKTNSAKIKRVEKRIFAAMSFDKKYDDVYLLAIRYAAHRVGATAERIDAIEFSDDVVRETEQRIRRSHAVVADLSAAHSNVMYETGFAHALGKPCVHISSTPRRELPFNVNHWNTIAYQIGRAFYLRKPLRKRLQSVLDETRQY